MSKNTISSIAGHLSYAFLPLKEAVSNLENFKIFCGRMGWDVTSLPQPYIDLADIVEDAVVAINSFSDNEEPDLKEIQNAFELIKSLWNAIKNLNSSPSDVFSISGALMYFGSLPLKYSYVALTMSIFFFKNNNCLP